MTGPEPRPIPIPPKQRWHEFRVTYAPAVTFLILVAAICWVWLRHVQPGNILGEVEAVRANIISVVPGTLQELRVDLLGPVSNGQDLAVLVALDPDQLEAETVAAETELRVLQRRMDVDKTRNLDSYARLRVDWLIEKLNLDLARIRLQQASDEYDRIKKLFENQIVARGVGAGGDIGLDVALRDRDALRSEVASRERTASDLEASVKLLEAAGAKSLDRVDPVVEGAIAAQRERIERLRKPVVLRSSIDGFVSAIHHRPGERVAAGTPILVVSSRGSDQIVAWVRQPITSRPRVGDIVGVRGGAMGGRGFRATVVRVGTQLEPISPALLAANGGADRIEWGLPLIVRADEVRGLIPGEAVQLRVIGSAGNEGAD